MRTAVLSATLLALASAAHAVDLGPLAPAAGGKVQCFSPNPAAKSCQSIGAYRVTPEGVIENEATVMVSDSPLIIMTTRAPVKIKAGADCGVLSAKDLLTSSFTLDGHLAGPVETTRLRAAMRNRMGPVLGHEICVSYRPQGEALLATSTVDGSARPDMDQKVIWVPAADGWKVGY